MEREILFRGKIINAGIPVDGRWIEGSLVQTPRLSRILKWDEDRIFYHEENVDPSTVGQYTGLKDKAGTRIFEGDIVEAVYGSDNEITGGFDGIWAGPVFHEGCSFNIDASEEYKPSLQNICIEEIEITGNIHDKDEVSE